MTKLQIIEKKIKTLPQKSLREVEKFIDSIITQSTRVNSNKLNLSWVGVLSKLNSIYTSVELQHKGSDWIAE